MKGYKGKQAGMLSLIPIRRLTRLARMFWPWLNDLMERAAFSRQLPFQGPPESKDDLRKASGHFSIATLTRDNSKPQVQTMR